MSATDASAASVHSRTTVALLEYFTSSTGTIVFAVLPDRDEPLVFEARHRGEPLTAQELARRADRLIVDFHGLPPGWDGEDTAARYRSALELPPAVTPLKRTQPILQRNLKKATFAYETIWWEELSDALLPAGLRNCLADYDLLCVVAHGPLHSLPLAALRWSDDEYLIERFGLCFAPSATVLRYCRAKNRVRAMPTHEPQSCLIAAVAAEEDEAPEDFEADGERLARLFSARSAARVTQLLGVAPTNGRRPASKDNVRLEIGAHDIVHVACHGVFDLEGPAVAPLDDAGLLVSDGARAPSLRGLADLAAEDRAPLFLSAREVLSLRLDADLITLRACSSGRAEVAAGDELLGLTRAFLYAGTPSLIVSLWNVNKRSSQRLLNDFYGHWLGGEGVPKWRALQLAQQGLLHEPEYAHPYHWAPFVLVGDWL